jgi:hypothetical protein
VLVEKKTFLALNGIQTAERLARSVVTALTTLSPPPLLVCISLLMKEFPDYSLRTIMMIFPELCIGPKFGIALRRKNKYFACL